MTISATRRAFRVGIVGLLHESNSFVRTVTNYDDFLADVVVSGPDLLTAFRDAPHELGGFIAGLEAETIEIVPLFAARAVPSGEIQKATWASLIAKLLLTTRDAEALDGILFAAHGAAVVRDPQQRDADGWLLSRVRECLGPELPLIATLDLHANLSRQMVDATNALIGYRTNPHVDQRSR